MKKRIKKKKIKELLRKHGIFSRIHPVFGEIHKVSVKNNVLIVDYYKKCEKAVEFITANIEITGK